MDGVNQSGTRKKYYRRISDDAYLWHTDVSMDSSRKHVTGSTEVDLFQVLLYVFIISVITAPLVKLQEYFVLEATQQAWFHVSPFRPLDRALNRVLRWIHKNFFEKATVKPKRC